MQSRLTAATAQVASTADSNSDDEAVEFPPSLSKAVLSTLDNIVQSSNLQSNFSVTSAADEGKNIRSVLLFKVSVIVSAQGH